MKNSEYNYNREGLPASMSEEPYFFNAEHYMDQLRTAEQYYSMSKRLSRKPGCPPQNGVWR